jgi:hypothetical protein
MRASLSQQARASCITSLALTLSRVLAFVPLLDDLVGGRAQQQLGLVSGVAPGPPGRRGRLRLGNKHLLGTQDKGLVRRRQRADSHGGARGVNGDRFVRHFSATKRLSVSMAAAVPASSSLFEAKVFWQRPSNANVYDQGCLCVCVVRGMRK